MQSDKEKISNSTHKLLEHNPENPLKENRCFLDIREKLDTQEAFMYTHGFYQKFDYFTLKTGAILRFGSDFCYGQILGVEHKTMEDFIASIHDGRIWQQATLLQLNFKWGVFAMSFDLCDVPLIYDKNGKEYNRNKVMTTLADILIRCGIYSQFCGDIEHTAYFCLNLAYKIRKEVQPVWNMRRPTFSTGNIAIAMLMAIPGIGEQNAVNILKRFGSITALANIKDVNRFKGIPGIGIKGKNCKAQRVIDVFHNLQPLIDMKRPKEERIFSRPIPERKKMNQVNKETQW
jgi:ERCC4-type nuclease